MTTKLYVWKAPRVSDPDAAAELLKTWFEEGDSAEGRPAGSRAFEATDDVHWFTNELVKDAPELEVVVDSDHEHGKEKWFWPQEPGPTDRLAVVTLEEDTPREVLNDIFSIAAKYDLVVYDPDQQRVVLPLEVMAAYADATFWPRGAIQAFVAGIAGGAVAVAAWFLAIPILSGVVVLAGGFMFVMAVFSFVHEGRKAFRARRT